MTAAPDTMVPGQFHEIAFLAAGVPECLLGHGGWMSTQELATKLDTHRDTMRRICQTLAFKGWLVSQDVDGKQMWTIGPELPRIGLAYLELLTRRAQGLRAEFDAATAAIATKVPE